MRDWETGDPMTKEELEGELNQFPVGYHHESELTYYRESKLTHALRRLNDYTARKTEVDDLIACIYDSGAEVAPFFVRSDVTIRLQEFFSDIEQGVFLRLFVPYDRLQAEQLKSLLSVLERYLRQVERQNFSIDSRKSEKGVVYVFRSDVPVGSLQSLNDAFLRFDEFMRICEDRPEQAQGILASKGLSEHDSMFFVEQYSREYKRLILDTKHEFERKSLVLRQRLETDILDQGGKPMISWSNEGVSSLVSTTATGGSVTVNIGSLSVVNSHKVQAEVEKIINGSVLYNDNDKLLLSLFSRHAEGLEALQHRSDLDQLKDKTVAEPARQNAKQRLLGFLRKTVKRAGNTAEKIGVEILTQYLESLMKGNV